MDVVLAQVVSVGCWDIARAALHIMTMSEAASPRISWSRKAWIGSALDKESETTHTIYHRMLSLLETFESQNNNSNNNNKVVSASGMIRVAVELLDLFQKYRAENHEGKTTLTTTVEETFLHVLSRAVASQKSEHHRQQQRSTMFLHLIQEDHNSDPDRAFEEGSNSKHSSSLPH